MIRAAKATPRALQCASPHSISQVVSAREIHSQARTNDARVGRLRNQC